LTIEGYLFTSFLILPEGLCGSGPPRNILKTTKNGIKDF
jgi:hypothetical protein